MSCFTVPAPTRAWIAVMLLSAVGLALPPARAEQVETGLLMQGTPCETKYWIKAGDEDGPRLFVAGGMHGDETAGYRAGDQLVDWRILRGTLILLPRAHKMAIARDERAYPGNMNAMFPGDPKGDLMHRLAAEIWKLMTTSRPGMVVTLHESVGFHRDEPSRFGQTLTYDFDALTTHMQAIIDRVNPDISSEHNKFMAYVAPYENCPTYQAYVQMHIPATSIETCRQLSLDTRIKYQLMMVGGCMDDLGMEYETAGAPARPSSASAAPPIPAAVAPPSVPPPAAAAEAPAAPSHAGWLGWPLLGVGLGLLGVGAYLLCLGHGRKRSRATP